MNLSELPKGTQIEKVNNFDGTTLSWKKPNGGVFRYFIIAFLVFWLFGWFAGFASALGGIVSDSSDEAKGFLIVWLGGWSLGGIFAGGMLYLLLRPQVPESVMFGLDKFKYDTGSPAMDFMNPFYMMRKKSHQMMNPFSMLFSKRKIFEYGRRECPDIILEGFGDDQRLRFDDGAERISIGESLNEPEREWLFEEIKKWKGYP